MTAFSVFSHRTWAVLFIDVIFAAVGYSKVGPAILVVCWKFVRLHYARLRFVSPQEHLYPHCFGTVSISSVPFHFFSQWKSSQNNFNKASTKIANTCTLQWKYKPHFEMTRNSILRLHKAQYRNRQWQWNVETYTGTTENPEQGIFWTQKQTNCKMGLEIFMTIFCPFQFLYAENLSIQNTPKWYE